MTARHTMRSADISVIIATHNRSSQVVEALDSALSQTLPPLEVVVVDDGSNDDTKDVLARYGARVRTFSIPQSGASVARNHAMRAASGKWIAFLDDDDVWAPEKLQRQMEVADRNPDIGLVYCSDFAVNKNLTVLYERSADPANRGDVFSRLLLGNFLFTSCVVARKAFIEEAGYMDPDLRFAQDWDLWLKVAAKHPVDFAPEPLVLYRQQPNCLTREMRAEDKLQEMQAILTSALSIRSVPAGVGRKAQRRMDAQWAAACLSEGRRWRAFRYSLQASAIRLMLYSLAPPGLRAFARSLAGKNATAGETRSAVR